MPVFMFLLPFVLGITVYRLYIEKIWLRKVCKIKKKEIARQNTGNPVMQLLFWNMKYEVDMIPYFLYLACFIVPFLLPLLWLIFGGNGVTFYYCLCLTLFGVSALLTLQKDRVKYVVGRRKKRTPENFRANALRKTKLTLIYIFGVVCTVVGVIGILP